MKPDTATSLEIVISDLKPRPKGRPRFVKDRFVNGRFIKGHAYTPKATRVYEDRLAWHFRIACKEPWTGPLLVDIRFKTKSKADIDNLSKVVLDAGNRILWHDDSQVKKTISEILDSDREELVVAVRRFK